MDTTIGLLIILLLLTIIGMTLYLGLKNKFFDNLTPPKKICN